MNQIKTLILNGQWLNIVENWLMTPPAKYAHTMTELQHSLLNTQMKEAAKANFLMHYDCHPI